MNEENVTQESVTEETTTTHNETVESSTSVAEPSRPEWLPEKFASPEDMAKSYGELESWKGKKEEDIRSAMQEEIEKERMVQDVYEQSRALGFEPESQSVKCCGI